MGEKVKEIIKDSKPVYVKNHGLCYQVDQNIFDKLRNIANVEAISWFVGRWGLEYIVAKADIENKLLELESINSN